MYLKSKNKRYTNFDVSDKSQRQWWYIFALLILLVTAIILFVTAQPRTLSLPVLFSLLLLVTSQIVNYFIKSSLHVSLNMLLSFLIVPVNPSRDTYLSGFIKNLLYNFRIIVNVIYAKRSLNDLTMQLNLKSFSIFLSHLHCKDSVRPIFWYIFIPFCFCPFFKRTSPKLS